MAPAQWCQAFFLVATGTVAVIQALPQDIRGELMDYGARRPQEGSGDDERSKQTESRSSLKALTAKLTSYGQVPHSWFLHFYVVSVAASAFWAWQYLQRGPVMREVARLQANAGGPSMELGQVFVVWTLMALQGSRRLYESLYVSKPGSSPMWVVHWALGLLYYTTMSISVWIEGSSAILQSWESPKPPQLSMPLKTSAAVALYMAACASQNGCHRYLASLKKYTLPNEGWFRYMVCPHYTFECLLYVAIAWAAAPQGKLLNSSVLCGLLFVAVNLGATARGTKRWYAQKFGAEAVAGRWIMIPFVF
ncbi:hypothetical protein G7046_g8831 [Stylonectria norvegica]|nr:hypothetical protein G7046_g8831 [Stylonectria norvegica]